VAGEAVRASNPSSRPAALKGSIVRSLCYVRKMHATSKVRLPTSALAAALDRTAVRPDGEVTLPTGAGLASGVAFTAGGGPRCYAVWSEAGDEVDVELAVASDSVHVVPLITDLAGNGPEWDADSSSGTVALTVDGAALLLEEGW
jgi:hypothetical protein